MMLLNILLLALVVAIALQFWRIRAISEAAGDYLRSYCQQQGLQLVSFARKRTRLTSVKGKPDWQCEFQFDFSTNGEDVYQGWVKMKGKYVVATELPVHRYHHNE
ncbi:hypothetical protein HMF8227_02163 [Saliniradius amylolyticus]|uniref:DUF3301 domain-containing protein n=1 Tax=Saliniradius amylolyticus TaxID=2183582 RepID=A0A2S2E4N6_9ALTE|nr:DUF3301 domain-containing protein [Saliniradius amylolyticus]AWL12621.1 hypothetical protein HMF8227_02163 [Saliniradius amylolyticus]